MALKVRRSTPEEKLRAVQLLKAGNNAATIAHMFGVSRAILFRWQQKYDDGGPSALEIKKAPGPASRLNSEQLSRLHSLIAGNDPRNFSSISDFKRYAKLPTLKSLTCEDAREIRCFV